MFSPNRIGLAVLGLAAMIAGAVAQSSPGFSPNTQLAAAALNTFGISKLDVNNGSATNLAITNVSINNGNLSGTLTGGTLSGTTLVGATFVGSSGTPNQVSVTCGTGNTTLLTANAAAAFISVQVPPGAGGPVWFNFANVSAVTAPPSVQVPVGGQINWSTAGGFLPTSQANCIASGSPVIVSVSYK